MKKFLKVLNDTITEKVNQYDRLANSEDGNDDKGFILGEVVGLSTARRMAEEMFEEGDDN